MEIDNNVKSDILFKYFKDLTQLQIKQFEQLYGLYNHWNAQINVVSRKDIEELYERHILHSLAIARFITFKPGEKILDVGTGGGFPGIPLAILFPETQFHLVDSIGKKIKVVQAVADELGLKNVKSSHMRAEEVKDKYNFIISRAVTRLGEFYPWIRGKFLTESKNALPNGIIYLKGGDLTEEIKESKLKAELYPLSDWFEEPFFETKYVLYIAQ